MTFWLTNIRTNISTKTLSSWTAAVTFSVSVQFLIKSSLSESVFLVMSSRRDWAEQNWRTCRGKEPVHRNLLSLPRAKNGTSRLHNNNLHRDFQIQRVFEASGHFVFLMKKENTTVTTVVLLYTVRLLHILTAVQLKQLPPPLQTQYLMKREITWKIFFFKFPVL